MIPLKGAKQPKNVKDKRALSVESAERSLVMLRYIGGSAFGPLD